MTNAAKTVIALALLSIASSTSLAQDEENDDPRANVHLGTVFTAPLNPTGQFSNFGWGITTGAGYNFTRRHAVVGDFTWNHLYISGDVLNSIRSAAQNPNVDGHGDLYSLTGNYRFELRGRARGTYFIAGGGLYHRNASLSQKITTGKDIVCQPVWFWWGVSCSSGFVTSDQTIGSSSATALGVNGGIGFTARVGEAPYRMYVETRYHYAPTKGLNTQLIELTVGIRY